MSGMRPNSASGNHDNHKTIRSGNQGPWTTVAFPSSAKTPWCMESKPRKDLWLIYSVLIALNVVIFILLFRMFR